MRPLVRTFALLVADQVGVDGVGGEAVDRGHRLRHEHPAGDPRGDGDGEGQRGAIFGVERAGSSSTGSWGAGSTRAALVGLARVASRGAGFAGGCASPSGADRGGARGRARLRRARAPSRRCRRGARAARELGELGRGQRSRRRQRDRRQALGASAANAGARPSRRARRPTPATRPRRDPRPAPARRPRRSTPATRPRQPTRPIVGRLRPSRRARSRARRGGGRGAQPSARRSDAPPTPSSVASCGRTLAGAELEA